MVAIQVQPYLLLFIMRPRATGNKHSVWGQVDRCFSGAGAPGPHFNSELTDRPPSSSPVQSLTLGKTHFFFSLSASVSSFQERAPMLAALGCD